VPLSEHLPAPAQKGPRCTVSVALDQLDRDDRHTLVGWLDGSIKDEGKAVTARRIAAAVQSATSLSLTVTTVHRHRRQECGCSQ